MLNLSVTGLQKARRADMIVESHVNVYSAKPRSGWHQNTYDSTRLENTPTKI